MYVRDMYFVINVLEVGSVVLYCLIVGPGPYAVCEVMIT